MKNPILFIHGFGGGAYEYRPVIEFLKKYDSIKCYEFVYRKRFGQISLEKIADNLAKYIEENISEKEIDIIAFSQGGIITRNYIFHYSDKIIKKCITLCTPHRGSFIAWVGFWGGIKELRPNSVFLKNLDTKKADYYAIYNPLDLFVFPGYYAKFKYAKENKRVFSLLHQFTFRNKKTLEFILEVLKIDSKNNF